MNVKFVIEFGNRIKFMKKILISFGLLILGISIYAQKRDIVLQADSYEKRLFNTKINDFPDWNSYKRIDMTIILAKDSLVILNNKEKDFYRLKKLTKTEIGVDSIDGDSYIKKQWIGFDRKDMIVSISLQIFRSCNVEILVSYLNIQYK